MSRPKPQVILKGILGEQEIEVCEEYGVFAVFYGDMPVKVRSRSINSPELGYKYKKSSYTEPGHAFNLANKLNKLFATDKFQVRWMRDSRVIQEEIDVE